MTQLRVDVPVQHVSKYTYVSMLEEDGAQTGSYCGETVKTEFFFFNHSSTFFLFSF